VGHDIRNEPLTNLSKAEEQKSPGQLRPGLSHHHLFRGRFPNSYALFLSALLHHGSAGIMLIDYFPFTGHFLEEDRVGVGVTRYLLS